MTAIWQQLTLRSSWSYKEWRIYWKINCTCTGTIKGIGLLLSLIIRRVTIRSNEKPQNHVSFELINKNDAKER
jgi:hypothetical protein